MDIFFIYVVKILLLPISSLLIISVAGLILMRYQRVIAVILIAVALASLLLLSLPSVARYLASTQEIYPSLNLADLEHFPAQAIVVLGGGLRYPALEYLPQVTLQNRTLARVRYAALLAKQARLPLLVTGGRVLKVDIPSEAEIMAQVLVNEFNQPVKWQERNSRNTAENALLTHNILKKEGVQHIILVTHALHMRRAVEQFRLQGFQVMPAPTMFLSHSDFSLFSLLPSASALQNSSLVIHEVMGRAWYHLRY